MKFVTKFATQPVVLCFIAGAVTVLGFAPFYLFPLVFFTFTTLFAQWCAATPRRAAVLGFVFGLGFFLAGVSWIYISLHRYGDMPAVLAGLSTVLFCMVFALYPAIAGYLFAYARRDKAIPDALLLAAIWTLTECLRGWVFTGFPWLALGYAHSPPSPLAGFAPLMGVYGLTFVSVLISALLLRGLRGRIDAISIITALLCIGGFLRTIEWTHPNGHPLTVSLLQGNIEQGLKWKPERLTQSLETYLRLVQRYPAQLVILPETALPLLLEDVPKDYLRALVQPIQKLQGNVLLGVVRRDRTADFYNSAVSMGTNGTQAYSKQHLVPFGEFTPPLFQWTLSLLNIPMSDFARGGMKQAPLAIAGEKLAVNICYEDVFGEEIIRTLPEATLLVNMSNIAWFGDSLAPAQHLQIAQLRALETGRFMLRATNTGMTAIVDPQGKIVDKLPPFTVGALTGQVAGFTGATPYVRWRNSF